MSDDLVEAGSPVQFLSEGSLQRRSFRSFALLDSWPEFNLAIGAIFKKWREIEQKDGCWND